VFFVKCGVWRNGKARFVWLNFRKLVHRRMTLSEAQPILQPQGATVLCWTGAVGSDRHVVEWDHPTIESFTGRFDAPRLRLARQKLSDRGRKILQTTAAEVASLGLTMRFKIAASLTFPATRWKNSSRDSKH
jgi:hypothetical protein